MNGRRSGGFSLRKSLEDQGVTTEDEMRQRLSLVHTLLSRGVDITKYRAKDERDGASV